jgi:hypothetical protein
MREKNAVLRGYGLVGCLAAVTLAGTLSACGGAAPVQSSPGASCSNYPLHGAGSYHNEASIRVEVSNATAHPARYAIDVTLTAAKNASGGASSMHVTIHGSLGSHASGELGRKVLTADLIQRCQVTSITRQSES